jgi:hypothetical protein
MDIVDIDLSNQIHNKWNKDTVIAAVSEKYHYSLKIRGQTKNGLKRHFIHEDIDKKTHKRNRRIIAIIYSYLVFKLLSKTKGHKIEFIRICPDHKPPEEVYKYLQKIFSLMRYPCPKIKFFKGPGRSPAHKYAITVFRGRIKPNYIIESQDKEELLVIIEELIKM